jgi:hypothetical protein
LRHFACCPQHLASDLLVSQEEIASLGNDNQESRSRS